MKKNKKISESLKYIEKKEGLKKQETVFYILIIIAALAAWAVAIYLKP